MGCENWLAVHKVLSAEGVVAHSATDMRGVQMAIERLVRSKVINIGDGEMSIRGDVENEEELETLIFPEEFVNEFHQPPDPAEGDLEEWEERLLEEADDIEDDDGSEENIGGDGAKERAERDIDSKPKSKPTGFKQLAVSKKRKAEITPDKSSKKQKKDKKSKKEKKKHKKERQAEKENDPALF